jgi:hypothetical protein
MANSEESGSGVEPPSYLESVAYELHEMFLALQEAGFTPKQALYLVGEVMAEGAMAPIYYERGGQQQGDYEDDEDEGLI